MISKNSLKVLKQLKNKKFRDELGLFIAEGKTIVEELLSNNTYKIKTIYALSDWLNNKRANINALKIDCEEINENELALISNRTTPNDVIAIIYKNQNDLSIDNINGKLTLVLDRIADPGNLGAIIRTADWFGIENIICSEDSVDFYNEKVVQASMGSFMRVNVYYKPLKEFLLSIDNKIEIYATTLKGKSIYEASLAKEAIIIMGNEATGISSELISIINNENNITIPKYNINKKGSAESLNVAIATALVCSEFKRLND